MDKGTFPQQMQTSPYTNYPLRMSLRTHAKHYTLAYLNFGILKGGFRERRTWVFAIKSFLQSKKTGIWTIFYRLPCILKLVLFGTGNIFGCNECLIVVGTKIIVFRTFLIKFYEVL